MRPALRYWPMSPYGCIALGWNGHKLIIWTLKFCKVFWASEEPRQRNAAETKGVEGLW